MKTTATIMAGIVIVGALTGCSRDHAEEPPPAPAAELPGIFVTSMPQGSAIPIPEARKQFKPGDDVILTGRIMGTKYPFVEGRSVFVLGDEGTLTHCDAMGEAGHCPTPWDTCCDTPVERAAGTVSIQVVGADGKVLPLGLKGVHGLKELSRVTVVGKVAPNASPEAFIINATAIHVASDAP